MQLRWEILDIVTDSNGDATVDASEESYGFLHAFEWVNTDFAAGVDVVLSMVSTQSGVDHVLDTLTNADSSAWYHPREQVSDNTGGGVAGQYTKEIISGILRVTVSNGGDTKTGKVVVYWEPSS